MEWGCFYHARPRKGTKPGSRKEGKIRTKTVKNGEEKDGDAIMLIERSRQTRRKRKSGV